MKGFPDSFSRLRSWPARSKLRAPANMTEAADLLKNRGICKHSPVRISSRSIS